MRNLRLERRGCVIGVVPAVAKTTKLFLTLLWCGRSTAMISRLETMLKWHTFRLDQLFVCLEYCWVGSLSWERSSIAETLPPIAETLSLIALAPYFSSSSWFWLVSAPVLHRAVKEHAIIIILLLLLLLLISFLVFIATSGTWRHRIDHFIIWIASSGRQWWSASSYAIVNTMTTYQSLRMLVLLSGTEPFWLLCRMDDFLDSDVLVQLLDYHMKSMHASEWLDVPASSSLENLVASVFRPWGGWFASRSASCSAFCIESSRSAAFRIPSRRFLTCSSFALAFASWIAAASAGVFFGLGLSGAPGAASRLGCRLTCRDGRSEEVKAGFSSLA